MRIARLLTVFSILILTIAGTAAAQTRKPAPRPTPRVAKTAINPIVAAAKQKVANQLFNVNVFVDKMGPIAVSIENSDRDAAARRLRADQIAANDLNKRKLVAAIRALREGLVSLESDFRTKPQLAQYLAKIQGISSLCAQSEDNAIAGRFVASKDPLRQVALKLNDTLAVLPGGVSTGVPSTSTRSQADSIPISNTEQKSMTTGVRTITVSNPSRPQPNVTEKREPSIGMTADEVLQTAWGTPSSKRTSVSPNGTTDVWLYRGNKTIYFFNKKVSNIVK